MNQVLLQDLFYYSDGKLFWKISPSYNVKVGSVAGTSQNGYISIVFNRKKYYAHRLIFLWHHGTLPKYIDHIDGNKSNNKIENLRPATVQQNRANVKPRSNTGIKSVTKNRYGTFRVRMMNPSTEKFENIGTFKTLEEATFASEKYTTKHHGEYARFK
jgi:hypothetical protein